VRIAYLGTSDFAAALLRQLVDAGRAPELVVTRPDRPKGRGRKLSSPPVADVARELGLELAQPEDINSFQPIRGLDAIVVCAYGALLKEPLLSEDGLLNVHPSLLPRWRGAAPIERAIMAGDAQTGVAIMRPTAGFDEGPVCAVQPEPIRADDDFATLSDRLVAVAAELLVRVFDEHPAFVEQPAEGVAYAEKIGPDDRTLDPSRTAVELDRVVRALHPHIGARLADGLGVRRSRPLPDVSAPTGLSRDGDRLLLGTASGALELLEVQPPGGRPMDAAAYLRGRELP
jgi:methionyl-tRNA formyltransferase